MHREIEIISKSENDKPTFFESYIKIAAKMAGVDLVDLASLEMHYETLDGTHPTKAGHDTIAKAWISCLKEIE